MVKNKLVIAAAGSGKTTYLVKEALKIKDGKVLITTYTRSNAEEIRKKIKDENKKETGSYSIPSNILVEEWFTFLLKHGVRPYKPVMWNGLKYKSIGFSPDFNNNYNLFKKESDVDHYFVNYKIRSNVISKFVVKCNEKSDNGVINRLQNIYQHVFIDEVQDLAGNDLEIIKLLFESKIRTIIVGDPRQVTYRTHYEKRHSGYENGRIKEFILEKCKNLNVEIDEENLKFSHRNNHLICTFSSRLYPNLSETKPCSCKDCHKNDQHLGIFVVRTCDVESYKNKYKDEIQVLRDKLSIFPERNFGESKGLTFPRVLIYPTTPIKKYLKNGELTIEVKNKKGNTETKSAFDISRFYVATTRARYSVAIVMDFIDQDSFIDGVNKFNS